MKQNYEKYWKKLASSKEYREELVAAQLKRGIPLQVRFLLKQYQMTQDELAKRSGLTRGVVSRAADPNQPSAFVVGKCYVTPTDGETCPCWSAKEQQWRCLCQLP